MYYVYFMLTFKATIFIPSNVSNHYYINEHDKI